MTNQFDSSGEGEQNAGQGDPVGRLERLNNKLHWLRQHPEVTWSGTGIYVVSLVVAAVVAAASWLFWPDESPPPQTNTISITGNNSGTAVIAGGNVTVNNPNVPPELLAQYAEELGATRQLINSFFGTLLQEKVPRDQWDSKLREIAANYKELLARLDSVQDADPQVAKLKAEAKQAIDAGNYAKAETLLEDVANQHSLAAAKAHADNARLQRIQLRYAKAAAYWQKAAALLPEESKKDRAEYLGEAGDDLYRIAKYKEALSLFEQGLVIQREIGNRAGEGMTLNNIATTAYAKGDYGTALKYLEQSLVIRREIGDRAGEGTTLSNIGNIYRVWGEYDKALHYLEQSLAITQEIGNKAGEGPTLNSISLIYSARGDYGTALKYLEQSLVIHREVGDRAGEGTTLSNIAAIHHAKGDYDKALPLWEQSLVIRREIGDRAGEGTTLSNIGALHHAKGDYGTALKYLEQSLVISREIGNRAGEAVTSWNIGRAYEDQGDLAKAEPYMSRAVQLAEELGHPQLEEWREALEDVRAQL